MGVSQRKEVQNEWQAQATQTMLEYTQCKENNNSKSVHACVCMSQLEERSGRRVSSTSGTPFKKAVVNTTQRKLEQQNEAHLIS